MFQVIETMYHWKSFLLTISRCNFNGVYASVYIKLGRVSEAGTEDILKGLIVFV
jgi:hypothetical protein